MVVAAAVVATMAVFVVATAFVELDGDDPVMVGAGDIADIDSLANEATARLLDDIEGTVFTVGDNVQGSGAAEEFTEYYDPTWGRHKDRTRPAPGNHEYSTPGADPYYKYLGEAAGDSDKGYYSYDIGEWHVVVMNSMCEEVGGCRDSAPQVRWLKEDLAANSDKVCTLAIGHHALFTSGSKYGSQMKMKPAYEELYDAARVRVSLHILGRETLVVALVAGENDLRAGVV